MLTDKVVSASVPVADLERSLMFYEGVLGLKAVDKEMSGAMLMAGRGTGIYLYVREPTKADHTVAVFVVADIVDEMAQLKELGVLFEEYDLPERGIKTQKGIASWPDGSKAAWFKDPDGNILSLNQI